jgi:hypothetical protein
LKNSKKLLSHLPDQGHDDLLIGLTIFLGFSMRTRMSARTFERFIPIARVIAGDQTPEWLPRLLHSWICDLHRARFVEPERPTRTEMREKLNRFEEAASLLREELASPYIREFLELDPNDVSLERHQIMSVLEDLARWANQARNCNTLVTEVGVTKAGSGRARSVASVSAQTYCAMIISDTWKFVHGAEPPPKSHRAAEAAEAYWRAAGGDPHDIGEEPLARWRYHFQVARKNKATTITAEYKRHLVENDRSWKLLHGFLEEAA